jgi:Raf kinase inhibitor-like YbhB/YbcL family protein
MEIMIASTAFKEGGQIPIDYTGFGKDMSPPLRWSGIPDGTKSFALICEDPDAPMGIWVHWVIYNIRPDTQGLPPNIPPKETLPNGAMQGKNDFRKIGYGGPKPPSGIHRYYLRIYALDEELGLLPGATKDQLQRAMKGHILSQGQLMGTHAKR